MGEGPERGRVKIGEIPTLDKRQSKMQRSTLINKHYTKQQTKTLLTIVKCGLKIVRNSILDYKMLQICDNLRNQKLCFKRF